MKPNKPLVSVIIPSYNHGKYLVLCIESIMSQTFKNFELIVIDDGSKDNSVDILEKLNEQYGFKLIKQENRGLPATLNRALRELAVGKYVSFCASDDYWAPSKLQHQVDFMEANPNIPMSYGKTHYIDEESNIMTNYDSNNKFLKGGWIFEDVFTFSLHPPVNYIYLKSVFDIVGYFDEGIFADDYYMNLKIASKYEIGFVNEYLGYYRVDSDKAKVIRFEKVSNSHLMSIEEYSDHPLYNKAKKLVYLRKFIMFAPYLAHKKRALYNAVKSSNFILSKVYISSLIKLFLFWK